MSDGTSPSRRTLLRYATGATAVGVTSLGTGWALAAPAFAQPSKRDSFDHNKFKKEHKNALEELRRNKQRILTGTNSPNGWEMEKVVDAGGSIWTCSVPGADLDGVTMRLGDVSAVLIHVIRRFNYEVETLRTGDVVGWRSPSKVRKGAPEGNQASGTAVQIRPGHYPSGSKGHFFDFEVAVIRSILSDCSGVVRWGGDDRVPDEALFYVDRRPGDKELAAFADTVRTWTERPGQGAGSLLKAPHDSEPGNPRKR